MSEGTSDVVDELDHDPAEPLGDLTPRAPRATRRSGLLPALILVAVVAALGFVLVKGLGDAALFFRNVDDAVADRGELGDRRFRMQGTPVDGTITEAAIDGETVVSFTVAFNGARADVVHRGDPPGLFQAGVPVVLEGGWTPTDTSSPTFVDGADDGWYFASTRMVVKHDEDYREDRLEEAETGGQDGRESSSDAVTP